LVSSARTSRPLRHRIQRQRWVGTSPLPGSSTTRSHSVPPSRRACRRSRSQLWQAWRRQPPNTPRDVKAAKNFPTP
jgi:hypothetical protein